MNILIVTQTFPLNLKDSTAHFMFDFVDGFSEVRNKVFVILPYHQNLNLKSFDGSINFLPFRYIWPDYLHLLGYGRTLKKNSQPYLFTYFLAPFYLFFCLISIYKAIKKYQIDVVNAHWILPNGLAAALVCRMLDKPLFITIPGSDAYIARKNLLFKLLAKIAAKSAKGLISNSPQLLNDLGEKGEIILYGVDKNLEKRPQNKLLKIASAGRLIEKKGFALLKEATPGIEIISGVTINELRRRLLLVDIFVLSSVRDKNGNIDGTPVVLIEAMAAGCAIVATDLPANRRVIKNGKDGILVKADVKEIKKAVESLRVNSNLRQSLGKSARKKINNYFTKEKVAKTYLNYFKKVLS